jgi:hypothetical protein
MAEGGTPQFLTIDGVIYEVHTFTGPDTASTNGAQSEDELRFIKKPAGGSVSVLVVAGGGGGGSGASGGWTGSGGGAGRFVYHPAFNVGDDAAWTKAGTISVKVGAGGEIYKADPPINKHGYNGGDSEFTRHADYKIIAKGGGGGGGAAERGLDGGSGGGSHINYKENLANENSGTAPAEDGVLNLGNDGHLWAGGGAGEYNITTGRHAGTLSAIDGVSKEYARGKGSGDPPGENGTGNGGGGKPNGPSAGSGKTGGSGIVIVRWPYEPE